MLSDAHGAGSGVLCEVHANGSNAALTPQQDKQQTQHAAAHLSKQLGASFRAGSAFEQAQWLLSAADAWRPSAAEFEATCQVLSKLGRGADTGEALGIDATQGQIASHGASS